MAIAFRVREVTYEIETVDGVGKSDDVDLSRNGEFLVVVDYVDTATPNTILLTERFIFNASETLERIIDRIGAYGRQVRDARIRASELAVHIGSVVPIPEPTP